MLDSIRVEYYGSPTPIKQIANITAPEASEILIKPFQVGDLKEIEKAIRSSDLGLAPNNDGKVIRLKIPAMSGRPTQEDGNADQEDLGGVESLLPQYPP